MKLPPLGYFLIPVLGETLLLRFLSRIFYPVKINNFYKPLKGLLQGAFLFPAGFALKPATYPATGFQQAKIYQSRN